MVIIPLFCWNKGAFGAYCRRYLHFIVAGYNPVSLDTGYYTLSFWFCIVLCCWKCGVVFVLVFGFVCVATGHCNRSLQQVIATGHCNRSLQQVIATAMKTVNTHK